MRNELELLIVQHGSYWVVALVAVAISKFYSDTRVRVRDVAKSLVAALAISYVSVEYFEAKVEPSTILIVVFVLSYLSDVVMYLLQHVGSKIKEDPSLLLKFLQRGNKK